MNKVDYKVLPAHDLFKIQEQHQADNTLYRRIARVFWNAISLIVFPIGLTRLAWYGIRKLCSIVVLPGQLLKISEFQRWWALAGCPKATTITVQAADDTKLDAVVIKTDQKVDPKEQKWIIFFPGNGQCYEGSIEMLQTLAAETGANVLMANYRGVGRSEGSPLSSHDLVVDGEAMVQYILNHEQGSVSKILLHGWSLGGGVATEVAALHPGMHLCNDRSFSTIREAARYLLPGGFILGKIAALAGWRFDGVASYHKVSGHKFMIFHKGDHIIRYEASLYKHYKKTDQPKPEKIKFKGVKGVLCLNGHCTPITDSPKFDTYKTHVAKALS